MGDRVEHLNLESGVVSADDFREKVIDDDDRPLSVSNGQIRGDIDLAHINVTRAIEMEDLIVDGRIDLRESHLRSFRVNGCHIGALTARGFQVEHALAVRDSEISGEVVLTEAVVGNGVFLNGTTIWNTDQAANALNLYRIQVGGGAYFEHGFRCYGTIRAIDANIAGILSFAGARILVHDPKQSALLLDRCVAPSVFLRNGFNAGGRVSLIGADVGGTLSLTKSRIVVVDGSTALNMDSTNVHRRIILRGAKIRGSVFMRNLSVKALVDDTSSWSGITRLELGGADIGRFGTRLDDGSLEDRIAEVGPEMDASQRIEVMCQRNRSYSPLPYATLRSAYKAGGQEPEARRLLHAQAADRWRRGPGHALVKSVVRCTYGVFLGYGCKPARAAACLGALMIGLWWVSSVNSQAIVRTSDSQQASTVTTSGPQEASTVTTSGPQQASTICNGSRSCLELPLYAIDVVLPVIDLQAEDTWTVEGSTLRAEAQRVAVAVAIALGWVLSGGVALGLRRVWRGE